MFTYGKSGVQKFSQNSNSHLLILGVTQSKFHTQDPQILGTTSGGAWDFLMVGLGLGLLYK